MTAVKTAISLDKGLFDEMDRLARRRGVPRSRLYAEAVELYLHRRDARDLTEQLNRVYDEPATATEKRLRKAAAGSFRRLVEGSW